MSLVQRLRRNPCAEATRYEAADELLRLQTMLDSLAAGDLERLRAENERTIEAAVLTEGERSMAEIRKLRAEVEELREYRRTHPYCEIDMDMHVEAVMSTANGAIKELEQEVERLRVAISAAFDALEDGDEAGAHLILRFIGGGL